MQKRELHSSFCIITYLSGYLPNSLYKYNFSNFNQIGGSIGFALNGMPNSISANYSQTDGERKYVDNTTTFLIGNGSNLKIGKVENTASAIGTTENGKPLRTFQVSLPLFI